MYCHYHKQTPATGACVHCGKLFCADCLVEVDGKYYCKEHVKLLFKNTGDYGYNNDNPYEEKPYDERYCGSPSPSVYMDGRGSGHMWGHSPRSRVIALVLCIFFGVAGFHRFYVGKIGTGFIWLFTGGFFGIGYLVDLLALVFGFFRDVHGRLLR